MKLRSKNEKEAGDDLKDLIQFDTKIYRSEKLGYHDLHPGIMERL